MIFTRHAIERFRQFHMLDRPTATDEDARVVLEAHAGEAVRIPARTHRGDEVWTIHALGVELVVKRDDDGAIVCVTILPPARFRGLTPLLAERVEESARQTAEKAAAAAQRLAEAKKEAEKKRAELAALAAKARKVKDKEAAAQAQRDHEARIAQARNEVTIAFHERDIQLAALKTMRQQLARERSESTAKTTLKMALRAALRCARSSGAQGVIDAVREIDHGLASDRFIDGGDAP